MGFPDHPSDQDRRDAPHLHVSPDQPTADYQQQGQQGEQAGQQAGAFRQTPGYPGQEYPGQGYQGQEYPGQGYQGQGYPGPGQQAGGYQPGYPTVAPGGRVNSMSIAALVCGLAQFLLWFLLLVPGFIAAVLALIFGAVSLGQIQRRGESGRGLALTGIILGVLGVLGGVALGILIGVGSAHYHAHMGY